MVLIVILVCGLAWAYGIYSLIEDGDFQTIGLAGLLTLFLAGPLLIS